MKRKLRLGILPEVPGNLHVTPLAGNLMPAHDPWNDPTSIEQGTFTFLNRTHSFGAKINWESKAGTMLWRFNLHYFHWIHSLDKEKRKAHCRDWIAANPVYTPVAWHPYPTSLRIINWCKSGVSSIDIDKSLYLQVAYLSRHLETYLSGNHVIENARALIIASQYFRDQGEAPRWFEQGLTLLLKETREQILADGVHYERSTMYHSLMLEAYLDVLSVLPTNHTAKATIEKTVTMMADFLDAMTHPDGNIALFNDATQEIAHQASYLIEQVRLFTGHETEEKCCFESAGYFIHRSPACYLVVDGGPIGPKHIPAHAHADVFSFELSLHGLQFIVDTGVFEYQSGSMRDYVRSTKAHNTVSVNGQDQVECWSAFRVGRRSSPGNVTFESGESGCRFAGTYDGFARLIGDRICHHREIQVDNESGKLTVVDRVTGKGKHRVESWLHFHPDVGVEEVAGETKTFKLSRAGVSCVLRINAHHFAWESGWYCPAFGRRLQNPVLMMKAKEELPVQIQYSLSY